MEHEFTSLGQKVVSEIHQAALDAERNPPKIETLDAYGKKISKLHTGWGWKQERYYSATEGIVAFSFEKDW